MGIADHSNSHINTPQEINIMESKNDSSNNTQNTYANAIANDAFPKKDQAIIVESKEGISIKEYVSALAKLVDSNSI